MNTFNELAQWATLLFLGVFIVGLTRQLGRFILPHESERPGLAPVQGPPVGARLEHMVPERLLEALTRARSVIEAGEPAVLVIVRDNCASCEVLLNELDSSPARPAVVALLTDPTSAEHVETVAAAVDDVVSDPDGQIAKDILIAATPFVLLLGEKLEVLHKQLGGTVDDALRDLAIRRARDDASVSPEAGEPDGALTSGGPLHIRRTLQGVQNDVSA
ncbi:MAG: hypothetical protein QOG42_2603 [Solirubrobacteraceae bacterium]|jgi:hypothetical protein|nr:hypothetical protein [Solirubrobacteraceae bacterium]